MPTIFGSSAKIASAASVERWLISNSRIFARSRSEPRFAMRYRKPKEACAYLALKVVKTMSGTIDSLALVAGAYSLAPEYRSEGSERGAQQDNHGSTNCRKIFPAAERGNVARTSK